jgi:hypothetical protein
LEEEKRNMVQEHTECGTMIHEDIIMKALEALEEKAVQV